MNYTLSHKDNFVKYLVLQGIFVALFVMAVVLYKERFYADSSYYVFKAINSGFFHVEHGRYVLIFSQLLPVIGANLHLNLKILLLLYSIGHVLFFYALFMVSYHLLKDFYASVAILCVQIIGINLCYFTPMFELFYGVGLLVVFNAMLSQKRRSIVAVLIMAFLQITILLSHPVNFFLLFLVLLLNFRYKEKEMLRVYLFFAVLFIATLVFKYFHFSPYEQGKVSFHGNLSVNKQYLNLLNFEYIKLLSAFLVKYYSDVLVMALLLILYNIIKRKIRRLIVVGGAFLGMLLLINVAYYAVEYGRYMEAVYFALPAIVIIPFMYDVLKSSEGKVRNVVFALVVVVLIVRVSFIIISSRDFTARIVDMKKTIEMARTKPGNKFVLGSANRFTGEWSHPIEILLISSKDGSDKTISIVGVEDYKLNNNFERITPSKFLFTKGEIWNDADLNKQYFSLKEGAYISF